MLHTETVILLLVCTAGVRSWQDTVDPIHYHGDESLECQKEKYSEKYSDGTESSCKKTAEVRGEGECAASRESGIVGEADCGTFVSEENDQSDLVMLGQEDQEFSRENTDAVLKECSQQTLETSACESLDSSVNSPKEEDHELLHESFDACKDAQQPDLIQLKDEGDKLEDNDDLPGTDDLTNKEPAKEELDSEQEKVPLREILMKLKPEGLTDDEDEQSSDYLASESSMGDESEVEEEALVSSGSSEKQEQNLDSNGTKGTIDGNGANSSAGSKKAVCLELNVTTETIIDVEVINATALLKLLQVDPNVTSRSSSGPCFLVYFFSPYCPFSIMGSPYVNALARSLPNIPIFGLDSIEHHSVNARYGVMGTPTLLLFHNGNGVGRYNASEYSVAQLMSFIRHYTDQELTNINVTSSDFRANLPSQLAEARPYALWAAWIFLLSFASWLFLTSDLCARLTEAILNNWREAEAQNDHQD
ncbi:thioredoxin domain-containing protein 15-like isoform X1 [Eriocheir sinensis]|uniref:thioredoxin domain-containing protein 15-like isoform X1 n=1 Tax=Eriocheir sinensis TaxID=95602 RepID=UPI0021C9D2E8|nr:thioredoxin domain-containing protein 15-like isoform X1 [Eriocheir sinensis]